MADKEERILISSKKEICQICKNECEEFDGIVPCGNCGYADFPSMTRQDAIEKMSKAIFYKTGFPKHCLWETVNEETRTVYRLYAREALNALLNIEE